MDWKIGQMSTKVEYFSFPFEIARDLFLFTRIRDLLELDFD